MRRLSTVLLLAPVLACSDIGGSASASAPADTAAGEVSFRLAGPGGAAMVVPAYINGEGPYDLILDTGATLTCLDASLVAELSLPERRAVRGTAVGIGGSGRVQIVAVDSLRVGNASTSGLSACALDLQALRTIGEEVRGLLGLDFLKSYRVTMDFEREVLVLTRAE